MKNDGGNAFPVEIPANLRGEIHMGMSLRDYFAAKALQGMLCNGFVPHEVRDRADDTYPKMAYELADLMLTERSKGKS